MGRELVDTEYYVLLAVWIVGPALLFAFHSRRGRLAGVQVYAYILGFFVAHWPGAMAHASPWSQFLDSTDTVVGFRLSTYALLAFLAGALVVRAPRRAQPIAVTPGGYPVSASAAAERFTLRYKPAHLLLQIGIAAWVLTFTPAANLPSAAAVLSAGKQCALLAICLYCLLAWQERKLNRFRLWLLVACALPVLTVITSGFIGYGIAMLGTILLFVAMFYRPRWLIFVVLIAGIYAGLSLWVAYANMRDEIRAAIWGGQGLSDRWSAVSKVFDVIEPFDISNHKHLDLVDLRLNQNALVGAAIRTTPQYVPFLYGETLYAAALGIIPRALWPDKPVMGGSGDYVGHHTMTEFAEGTSVGMGQVLEFYINWGVPAVVTGLFLLGIFLRRIDTSLVQGIETGNYTNLQFYFLVGAGAVQPGGSLSEMISSMAGGAVLALGVSRLMLGLAAREASRRAQADRLKNSGGRVGTGSLPR